MGIGFSIHKAGGWMAQLERVQRWHDRITKISTQEANSKSLEECFDFLYAFFQNCYHLRDWLQNSNAVPQYKLDQLFHNNFELQLCGDICNGIKHFDITHSKLDAGFSIGQEYLPKGWPGLVPIFIIAGNEKLGSRKYNIFQLADNCMIQWKQFLVDNGLVSKEQIGFADDKPHEYS